MSQVAKKEAVYADLLDTPENMRGEIINGELMLTPRPSREHTSAAAALGFRIGPPYQFGEGGGPGGWIIILEPEIGLGRDILVPDLAGWRRERFPVREPHNWISVTPDWICEILSPGTVRMDRISKMRIYGQHGVGHYWILSPMDRTLETFKLEAEKWVLLGAYAEDERVKAEPFEEIELHLSSLWL